MKLLLDTQVFLWFISSDKRLPDHWRDAIRDPTSAVYLSVASVWEAVVKQQLGKLPLPDPAETFLPEERDKHRISTLPIEEQALLHLAALPPLHRDPFDRMLISQALQPDLTMQTVDQAIKAYPVKVMSSTG
ncbi:MAG: type II toxin-antitoxin system VapC family toxin [Pirellulales bacterium]